MTNNNGTVLIDAEVVHYNRATIATVEVTLWYKGHVYDFRTFKGEAIRTPGDKNNKDIAERLALGRALENAGRKLQKSAWGDIENADYVKAVKTKKGNAPKIAPTRVRKGTLLIKKK